MIATEVASPFLEPFKLTIMVAVTISVPYLFHQGWAFIAPGLYRNERRLVLPLLVSSTLLFYAGILFAYFAVFPLVFGFFTEAAPEGVTVMTDISRYLDFVLKLFLASGARCLHCGINGFCGEYGHVVLLLAVKHVLVL